MGREEMELITLLAAKFAEEQGAFRLPVRWFWFVAVFADGGGMIDC